MSITTLVIEQSAVLSAASPPVLTSGGVFDRVNDLSADAITTIKIVGVVVGAFVAVGGMVRARGAVGGTIVSFLVGAFIGWAVLNIDNANLQNEIGSDLTSAPASAPEWSSPGEAWGPAAEESAAPSPGTAPAPGTAASSTSAV